MSTERLEMQGEETLPSFNGVMTIETFPLQVIILLLLIGNEPGEEMEISSANLIHIRIGPFHIKV
jgi:hypothetical protein